MDQYWTVLKITCSCSWIVLFQSDLLKVLGIDNLIFQSGMEHIFEGKDKILSITIGQKKGSIAKRALHHFWVIPRRRVYC